MANEVSVSGDVAVTPEVDNGTVQPAETEQSAVRERDTEGKFVPSREDAEIREQIRQARIEKDFYDKRAAELGELPSEDLDAATWVQRRNAQEAARTGPKDFTPTDKEIVQFKAEQAKAEADENPSESQNGEDAERLIPSTHPHFQRMKEAREWYGIPS